MPRLNDPEEIRRRLERDRSWSVYALGDLAPGYRDQSEWYTSDDYPDAMALIYRAGAWPILFTLGDAEAVRAVLGELLPEPRLSLAIRVEHLPAVESRWRVLRSNAMWRMILDPEAPALEPDTRVASLTLADAEPLQALFRDGRHAGEEPDFFFPSMLTGGTYFGVKEGDHWIAAAGTHLVAESEGVATIGNVYVRRDRRGSGLARAVVGAVIAELRHRMIPTIALNVRQANSTAARVYERLGFQYYCPFTEGWANLR